jgi:hypothetical protein
MRFSRAIYIFSCTLLCACTSVAVNTPYPQIETPMVAGKTTFGFGLYGESGRTVQFSSDASTRPPDWNDEKFESTTDLEQDLMMGFGTRFQVGAQYGFFTHMPFITAKLQLLGDPRTTAKAGNISLAVYGRTGWQSNSNSGNQDVTFGPGGFPWSSRANLSVMGFGGSAGIHLDDKTMIFGGVAYDAYRSSARITQDASSDGSSPAYSVSTAENGWAQSVGGGLSFGRSFVFNLSALGTHFKWGANESINAFSMTAGFEYFFLGGSESKGSAPSAKK